MMIMKNLNKKEGLVINPLTIGLFLHYLTNFLLAAEVIYHQIRWGATMCGEMQQVREKAVIANYKALSRISL